MLRWFPARISHQTKYMSVIHEYSTAVGLNCFHASKMRLNSLMKSVSLKLLKIRFPQIQNSQKKEDAISGILVWNHSIFVTYNQIIIQVNLIMCCFAFLSFDLSRFDWNKTQGILSFSFTVYGNSMIARKMKRLAIVQ